MVDGTQIKAERERRGWSQAELAINAREFMPEKDRKTLVQQAVDRVENGSNSKYRIAILRALDLPIIEDEAESEARSKAAAARIAALNVDMKVDAPPFSSLAGPRDVEELGVAVGGRKGDFEFNGYRSGWQPRPPGLIGKNVFAVRIKNDSMHPRFKDGELVYVERNREPAVGDDAIIELIPASLLDPSPAFIKELVKKGAEEVIVRQHNPKKLIKFKRDSIKQLYRVVPWNECFGV